MTINTSGAEKSDHNQNHFLQFLSQIQVKTGPEGGIFGEDAAEREVEGYFLPFKPAQSQAQ